MEVITGSQMREMDSFAINTLEIPSIVLMELAGYRLYEEVVDIANDFIIVVSTGNNGGDGLVVARHLFLKGKNIKVFMVGNKDKMTEDCKINYNILTNFNIPIYDIKEDYSSFQSAVKDGIVIEGIFGTGISRNVEGLYRDVINTINDCGKYIISIDIPSGIDGDNGKVWGCAIVADKTVTFHKQKQGLLDAGEKYTGIIKVKYIGICEKSQIL